MNTKIFQKLGSIPYYFLLCVVFASCAAERDILRNNSWQLVYENDKDGKPVKGDVNDLIKAVQNGKDVRVMVLSDDQQFLTDAENVWIKNGIVYIQNSSNISVIFKEDKLFVQDNAYHWFFTISSKGDRIMSRWLVGEHTSRGSNSDKVAVKWFVR